MAAAAAAVRERFRVARLEMSDLVTVSSNKSEDKDHPNRTNFITAAWIAAQIPVSVDAPTKEQINFTYMSTVMTVQLWVIVLREGLLKRRDDIIIGLHGAEIPGPTLIQLRRMLAGLYTKTNEWADKVIDRIIEHAVDLSRRIELLLWCEVPELFVHLRYALREIEKDLVALKTDQLHKEHSKQVGQKFASMKRHRPEEFSFGDAAIAKALGKTGEKD